MKDDFLIDGVLLTKLKEIPDPKGSVLHMLRNDDDLFTSFGECYFSEVNINAVKGWKKHLSQSQNISVPLGRIKFVLYDDRESSATFKNISEIILGRPDSYYRLHIPNNVWYSFGCISETNSMIVNCSDIPHSPDESETLPIDNKEIPYSW